MTVLCTSSCNRLCVSWLAEITTSVILSFCALLSGKMFFNEYRRKRKGAIVPRVSLRQYNKFLLGWLPYFAFLYGAYHFAFMQNRSLIETAALQNAELRKERGRQELAARESADSHHSGD